jgi:hypothetical protein
MARMQCSTWLRIAAILTAVFAVGHTAGMPWTPLTFPNEQAVVDAMKDVHFGMLGVSRSYWNFYQGFGLAISVLLFVQVALLWQSAALARAGGARLGPMIVTQLAGFLAFGAVAAKYIFAVPLILAAAIACCLVGALLGPRPESRRDC